MALRNPKDFWTGVVYVAVGAVFLLMSRSYQMGTAHKMGPAYFPSILSGLLMLIGAISLLRSFLRPGSSIGGVTVKGLLVVTVSTIAFGLLLRPAGFLIAMPVLVVGSAAASSRFRWPYAIAMAAGLTFFCWLIFLKGLGVPLPLLGSWFTR